MGWLALGLIGAAAMAAMALLGIGRSLWSLIASALMLGAAGYALQGSPDLPGRPVAERPAAAMDDQELIDLRTRMFGRFGPDDAYLVAADGMARAGEKEAAVDVLLGAIRRDPKSAALWTALGTNLAAHDGDTVSPPALFAFRRAMALAPNDPAPPFFAGVAYVRASDFAATKIFWQRALQLTPADAPYRQDIALRLQLLDRALAMSGME